MKLLPGIVNLVFGILIICICLPCYMENIKPNHGYGFRVQKAFESEENWYKINKYGAKQQMIWAVPILIIGIGYLFFPKIPLENPILYTLMIAGPMIIFSAIPILLTMHYVSRL